VHTEPPSRFQFDPDNADVSSEKQGPEIRHEAIGLDPNEAAVDDAASFPNPGPWSELNYAADATARIAGPIRRDEGDVVGRSQEEQRATKCAGLGARVRKKGAARSG
jgi:hypothetical protein